jgi:hypothetical protein
VAPLLAFEHPDDAVAAYARRAAAAGSPGRASLALGLQWARSCSRPRCSSTTWRAVWLQKERRAEARCVRCHAPWASERVVVGAPTTTRPVRSKAPRARTGARRDGELAEVASLGLLLARVPPWTRLVYASWVLCPLPGRREALVAAQLEARFPWAEHGDGVLEELRACRARPEEDARDALGRRLGERGPRIVAWSWRQVRALRDAGRRALALELTRAGLLARA